MIYLSIFIMMSPEPAVFWKCRRIPDLLKLEETVEDATICSVQSIIMPQITQPVIFATSYIRNKDIDTMRHEELILQLAKNKGFVTRADAMELLHLTPQQASRLLQKLASSEKNKLHLIGYGAGAKYYIE